MKSAKGVDIPELVTSELETRGMEQDFISWRREGRQLQLKQETEAGLQDCVGCVQTGMCRTSRVPEEEAGDGAGLEKVSGFARPEGNHILAGLSSQPQHLGVPSSGRQHREVGRALAWESEAWMPATTACHLSWPQFPPL